MQDSGLCTRNSIVPMRNAGPCPQNARAMMKPLFVFEIKATSPFTFHIHVHQTTCTYAWQATHPHPHPHLASAFISTSTSTSVLTSTSSPTSSPVLVACTRQRGRFACAPLLRASQEEDSISLHNKYSRSRFLFGSCLAKAPRIASNIAASSGEGVK